MCRCLQLVLLAAACHSPGRCEQPPNVWCRRGCGEAVGTFPTLLRNQDSTTRQDVQTAGFLCCCTDGRLCPSQHASHSSPTPGRTPAPALAVNPPLPPPTWPSCTKALSMPVSLPPHTHHRRPQLMLLAAAHNSPPPTHLSVLHKGALNAGLLPILIQDHSNAVAVLLL
jgi:hypothetical protein